MSIEADEDYPPSGTFSAGRFAEKELDDLNKILKGGKKSVRNTAINVSRARKKLDRDKVKYGKLKRELEHELERDLERVRLEHKLDGIERRKELDELERRKLEREQLDAQAFDAIYYNNFEKMYAPKYTVVRDDEPLLSTSKLFGAGEKKKSGEDLLEKMRKDFDRLAASIPSEPITQSTRNDTYEPPATEIQRRVDLNKFTDVTKITKGDVFKKHEDYFMLVQDNGDKLVLMSVNGEKITFDTWPRFMILDYAFETHYPIKEENLQFFALMYNNDKTMNARQKELIKKEFKEKSFIRLFKSRDML